MTTSNAGLYGSGRPSEDRNTCPCCGGRLVRTPRRLVDRLISQFTPILRYRCERFLCQWQGNIRMNAQQEAADTGTSSPNRLF